MCQSGHGTTDPLTPPTSGYLPETELIFTLSLFIKLEEPDPNTGYPHLKSNIRALVKKSLNELQESEYYTELVNKKFFM